VEEKAATVDLLLEQAVVLVADLVEVLGRLEALETPLQPPLLKVITAEPLQPILISVLAEVVELLPLGLRQQLTLVEMAVTELHLQTLVLQ
jgi:hypothetical protein